MEADGSRGRGARAWRRKGAGEQGDEQTWRISACIMHVRLCERSKGNGVRTHRRFSCALVARFAQFAFNAVCFKTTAAPPITPSR